MILVWAAFGNAVYDRGYNWFFIETSIFPFLSDEIMPVMVVVSVFGTCLVIYGAYFALKALGKKKPLYKSKPLTNRSAAFIL